MNAARLVRAGLAGVLVTIASGAPRTAIAFLEDDCCVEQCDRELGGKSCTPDCTSASCVKVLPSAVAPPAPASSLVVSGDEGAVPPEVDRPALPLVVRGVFHPPRR